MEKTKAFIESHHKWQILGDYVSRIEHCARTGQGLAIENCKSLVEAILKTIIVEVENKTEDDLKNDNFSKLTNQVKKILRLEKTGYSQVIGSYASSISQLRNELGETSHGKDIKTLESRRKILSEVEMNFLLGITDSTTLFLLAHYKNLWPNFAEEKKESHDEDNKEFKEPHYEDNKEFKEPHYEDNKEFKKSHYKDNKEVKEPHYEDNKEFNEWFDENHSPTKVSGVGLISSRALFDNNEGVYKSYLLGYKCRDKLIERLRASPNFATTHEVVAALSRYMDFSSFQIRRIWQAYMGNAQIFWISSDSDIKCFFETIILGNSNLFSQEEINKFSDTFSCYSE